VRYCLLNSKQTNPGSEVIVIKDSSVSNASPEIVARIVQTNLEMNNYDVSYLCKWMDKCNLYTNKRPITMQNPPQQNTINDTQELRSPIGGSMGGIIDEIRSNPDMDIPNPVNQTLPANELSSVIVRTQSPNGIQAMIFSTRGRDIILGQLPMRNGKKFNVNMPLSDRMNQEIFNGNIVATCIVPNLFDFNLFKSKSVKDYDKLRPCGDQQTVANDFSNNFSAYWWFIGAVVLIFIIAWALIQLGP
jgi:hypothetical protein